jgi:ammonium transporter, Amt family
MAWLPMMTAAVIGIQWFLWGYSITFSKSSSMSAVWGGSDGLVFHKVLLRPQSSGSSHSDGVQIPEALYALFEGMFASFT